MKLLPVSLDRVRRTIRFETGKERVRVRKKGTVPLLLDGEVAGEDEREG
jgi:hypothetical protein